MWRVTVVFYGQLPLSGYSRSWGKRMKKQEKLEGSNASLMYHPGVFPEWPLAGISHLASCPRRRGPYFVILLIFVLLHSFASPFSCPLPFFSGTGTQTRRLSVLLLTGRSYGFQHGHDRQQHVALQAVVHEKKQLADGLSTLQLCFQLWTPPSGCAVFVIA